MDDSDEEYNSQDGMPSVPILKDGVSRRTRSNKDLIQDEPISDLKNSNGYSWEDEYQRSWDIVKDDENEGRSLESIIQVMIENRKKKIMKNPTTPFQRGIIRTLVVVIDGSLIMLEKDLRPTRFSMTVNLLQDFIVEFFDQNPISQLGIVMMRNGISNLISEVSGLPQYHIDKIRYLKSRQHNKFEPKGDPSLQNSLEMARSLLINNFGNNSKNSKEILIIFGALFTSDPGDIHKTIDNLVKDEIKVKIIGLSAQVAICQKLVNKTNHQQKNVSSKNYGVIMNESHFKELFMDCVVPLPISTKEKFQETGIPLIRMGFPSKVQQTLSSNLNSNLSIEFPQLSASNTDDLDKKVDDSANLVGYQCPQCKSKVCNLPTICPVCGLMLILSTHLARSYHHLVPLAPYKEVEVSATYKSSHCFGCLLKFPGDGKNSLELLTSSRFSCMGCAEEFCIDCDVFIHEVLHNCPGCENK